MTHIDGEAVRKANMQQLVYISMIYIIMHASTGWLPCISSHTFGMGCWCSCCKQLLQAAQRIIACRCVQGTSSQLTWHMQVPSLLSRCCSSPPHSLSVARRSIACRRALALMRCAFCCMNQDVVPGQFPALLISSFCQRRMSAKLPDRHMAKRQTQLPHAMESPICPAYPSARPDFCRSPLWHLQC